MIDPADPLVNWKDVFENSLIFDHHGLAWKNPQTPCISSGHRELFFWGQGAGGFYYFAGFINQFQPPVKGSPRKPLKKIEIAQIFV